MSRSGITKADYPLFIEMERALTKTGYYYAPQFGDLSLEVTPLLSYARTLGRLVVPPGNNFDAPFVKSHVSVTASEKRPFDRYEQIDWHNDFVTHTIRPRWSLAWIRREDPKIAEGFGQWGVATADAIIYSLKRFPHLLARATSERVPFGYASDGCVRFFKIIRKDPGFASQGMRFNSRALREGSMIAYGKLLPWIDEFVSKVEEAATNSAHRLPSTRGSLLVVDNWRVLHKRTKLSNNTGSNIREVYLCFVSNYRGSILSPRRSKSSTWK